MNTITWQTSRGQTLDICDKCADKLGDISLKDRAGEEYCSVSMGLHDAAHCDVCGGSAEGFRALRVALDFTQATAADHIGVGEATVASWESGRRPVPRYAVNALLLAVDVRSSHANDVASEILAALQDAEWRWEAASDPSWAAANNRTRTRRAYRVNLHVAERATPVKLWAASDVEDSRWQGEGHSETISLSSEEPSQIVGGWGGGPVRHGRRRDVVHVYADRFCSVDTLNAALRQIAE